MFQTIQTRWRSVLQADGASGPTVFLLRWTPLAIAVGLLAGTASALLLWSLEVATRLREEHPWCIALLPLAGLAVGCLYRYLGESVEAGNNLILQEIHEAERPLPLRMAPLILIGTFATHLFGGSAGREGTALQLGASLSDQLARPLRLSRAERRILLMAGLSAGFGSVFGTPLAGAVFGLEVCSIGSLSYAALVPCLLAALAGDLVTRAWGVHHTVYSMGAVSSISAHGVLLAALAGAVFGLASRAFAAATHRVAALFQRGIPWPPLRPFVGGIAVALGVAALRTTRYVGLGEPVTVAAFHGKLPIYDSLGKFVFTVVTLGSGFKGGEVTPLFFIGATLGNGLSHVLPLQTGLLAAMGFAAVFAGAANTPLAATLMAVELFGADAGPFCAIACVCAYLFSGSAGIYRAQRAGAKFHGAAPALDPVASSTQL